MADKLMHIPNDDFQNYPLCTLGLVVETFQLNLMNQLIKIFKATNDPSLSGGLQCPTGTLREITQLNCF